MSFLMTVANSIWIAIVYIFFTTGYWLSLLFVVPFNNLEILWVLIPIWINLLFTDFFQEKKGTGMGNAITNGAVSMWVGVDWLRYLIRNYSGFNWILANNFLICLIMLFFGSFIVYRGIKGKKYVKYLGRVREISYLQLMFSLVIYGVVGISWKFIIIFFLYFPVFYYIFEIIDKHLPDIINEEEDKY